MEGRKTNEHGGLMRLSDFTIHEITVALTEAMYKGVRPNCERNWRGTTHGVSFKIPWPHIWKNPTLPLADATESKAWVELLHRNWRANNRFEAATQDHECRLGCGEEESMLHMIKCSKAITLWTACFDFSNAHLGTQLTASEITRAVIFNIDARGQVLNKTAAAFLRHALSTYYTAATKVATQKKAFTWQVVYYYTLCSFRDAVLRWAMSIRAHNTKRRNTNLVEVVSEDTRKMHATLVMIPKTCDAFALTDSFQKEIQKAKINMETHLEHTKKKKGQPDVQRDAQQRR
jgi:hypothetical protein